VYNVFLCCHIIVLEALDCLIRIAIDLWLTLIMASGTGSSAMVSMYYLLVGSIIGSMRCVINRRKTGGLACVFNILKYFNCTQRLERDALDNTDKTH
jgi:hypothetical protein